MKYNITIVFFLLTMWVHCQPSMHKIFSEGQTYCVFKSALVVDSGYIVQGQVAKEEHNNQPESMLVFIDTLGNSDFFFEYWDTNNFQRASGNIDRLTLNTESNLEFGFTNYNNGSDYRLLEVNLAGEIISDILLDTIAEYLNYDVYDNSSYLRTSDNRKWVGMNASPIGPPTVGSTFFFKLNSVNSILKTIEFRDINEEFSNIHAGSYLDSDTTFILVINVFKQSPADHEELSYLKLVRVDTSLNILNEVMLMDEYQSNYQNTLIKQGNQYVLSYWQGYFSPIPNVNQGYWRYLNTLSGYDYEFNELWRVHSDSVYTNNDGVNRSILHSSSDSTFFSVSGTVGSPNTDPHAVTTVKEMTKDGKVNWSREHILFENLPLAEQTIADIKEVSVTQDGGCLVIGNYKNNGYILKTNCLGFLGDPIADFTSTTLDDFTITFENQSIQAGGYSWDFGDGTTYRTGENETTVSHTFDGFGYYDITLIAEGCNGVKDTIVKIVEPKKHADAQNYVAADNGAFTLFPNPSIAGNSIYMYLSDNLNAADAKLVVTNAVGKEIYTQNFTAKEGTYVLPINLSAGNYNFTLYTSDKKQSKKVVVN